MGTVIVEPQAISSLYFLFALGLEPHDVEGLRKVHAVYE